MQYYFSFTIIETTLCGNLKKFALLLNLFLFFNIYYWYFAKSFKLCIYTCVVVYI